jgi:hypothetical protein
MLQHSHQKARSHEISRALLHGGQEHEPAGVGSKGVYLLVTYKGLFGVARDVCPISMASSSHDRASQEETQMRMQALTLDGVNGSSFEEVIQDIVGQESIVTVLLPNGQEVLIQRKLRLKALPKLEGHLPEGWKDALYARC